MPSGVRFRIDGSVVDIVTTPVFEQRWGGRRGTDRHTQTVKDLPYRLRRIDRAEDAHSTTAKVAFQRVDGEHPFQQFRPGVPLGTVP